ncbi:MAG: hypothetical protein J0L56_14675 [Chitinophagales bacterium]|nr:hypothetical protein [Chitinophagales bacterium]
MKKLILILYISTTPFLLLSTSCSNSTYDHWTEEEINAFTKECAETDTITNLHIVLRGFENSEFDSILIKEYKNTVLIDSFKVLAWPTESSSDKIEKQRSAAVFRAMNINYRYELIIPGQQPYELKEMKIMIHSAETENSDGYICEMRAFTLDGVRFIDDGNPVLLKRNISRN